MRRAGPVVLLILALVGTALFATNRRNDGPPLDPTSVGGSGTKAFVALLESTGAEVEIIKGPPTGTATFADTAILLSDRLSSEQGNDLTDWVEEGGRLVVADTFSSLSGPLGGSLSGRIDGGNCTIDALDGLDALVLPDRGVTGYQDFTGAHCFGNRSHAVVVKTVRDGAIISVAGPDLWTNEFLGEGDNAALAVALLAPTGRETIYFVQPATSGVGEGERSLTDLIDTPVRALVFQLAIAFGFFVLWRSRRLGRPVADVVPVEIEGGELTKAVGRLLATNRRPDRAAAILRDRTRRDLAARLGLAHDAPPNVVVEVVSARSGLDPNLVARALQAPVINDTELLECATALATIRKEFHQ